MERLTSLLLRGKTTRARFRFPLSSEQSYSVLLAAYKAEVEHRKCAFVASKECLESIKAFASKLSADNAKFGTMFSGTCGNGKTTLLYAFRSALGYLSNAKMFEEAKSLTILAAKDIALFSRDYDQFKRIRDYSMLGIDDLGREPKEVVDYGNIISPLVDLLEYRYNEQLFTLVTTNLTPKEIKERYGERIADRFNEMMDVIIFKNGSYRGKN